MGITTDVASFPWSSGSRSWRVIEIIAVPFGSALNLRMLRGDDPVMNALCIALEKSLAEFTVSVFIVNESLRLPSNIHDH